MAKESYSRGPGCHYVNSGPKHAEEHPFTIGQSGAVGKVGGPISRGTASSYLDDKAEEMRDAVNEKIGGNTKPMAGMDKGGSSKSDNSSPMPYLD